LGQNREINLDLTLGDAFSLYSANDKIRSMAASGELQQFHSKRSTLENDVRTGFLRVMENIDRTLA
jgi:hypothetical protein